MADLSAALRLFSVTAHSGVPVLWLLEVETPEDPPRRYRLVNNPEEVEFDYDASGEPIVYRPAPFEIQPIAETRQNEQTTLQVVVGALDNELSHRVDEWNGLTDQPVSIIMVSQLDLLDPTAAQRFEGRIHGASMTILGDMPALGLEVGAGNLYDHTLPRRRIGRARCGVKFGGLECGYIVPTSPTNSVGGGFDFCPRDLPSCEERGEDESARGIAVLHPQRFDAFKGVPRQSSAPLG